LGTVRVNPFLNFSIPSDGVGEDLHFKFGTPTYINMASIEVLDNGLH